MPGGLGDFRVELLGGAPLAVRETRILERETDVRAQRREIGMRWTLFGIALQLTVAWTVAVAVFQIARLLS